MPGIDENTLLIIHGNEIKDSSKYGKTITNNNVTVNTATTKFGNGSLYFNGSNSKLNLTAYQDMVFGGGDFTVDWWEYRTRNAGSVFNISYTSASCGLLAAWNQGTQIYATVSGNSWDLFNAVAAFSPTVNQWVHWALVRNGNNWRTYKNGVKFWETTNAASMNTSNIAGSVIGCHTQPDNDFFQGYIEEFRVSNVARWTEDFTPPTEQYTAHPIASHTFLGLENEKTFYARVYPQNPKKYFQSELTGQVAIAETGGGGTEWVLLNTYTQGTHTFTATQKGKYRFEVYGASGNSGANARGDSNYWDETGDDVEKHFAFGGSGGSGAYSVSEYNLEEGKIASVICGGVGQTSQVSIEGFDNVTKAESGGNGGNGVTNSSIAFGGSAGIGGVASGGNIENINGNDGLAGGFREVIGTGSYKNVYPQPPFSGGAPAVEGGNAGGGNTKYITGVTGYGSPGFVKVYIWA